METSENEEDLKDLEVRLYSQVHHEAVDIEPTSQTKTSVENECCDSKNAESNGQPVGSANSKPNRYWEVKEKSTVSQHKKFVKSSAEGDTEAQKSDAASSSQSICGEAEKTPTVRSDQNQQKKSGPGGTPFASGGAPEKKRSINPFSVKPPCKSGNNKEPNKKPWDASGGFQDRKLRKLQQAKKILQKREKSKAVRLKKKKSTELIVLDSSDDEDVVVIPVPPPPVVNLDSSDEEDSFLKPSDPKKANASKADADNSRCNSPNSVMSDDFIVQQDKKRLLSETAVAEDDELQCNPVDTDEALVSADPGEGTSKKEGSFVTPPKRVSKMKAPDEPTYEVTQSNFRAVDVYESESSDMPESIYAKGKRKRQSDAGKSSGSEEENTEAVAKMKRLRKRKASGSNKGSEHNDDSSDSEIINNSATALPFISRGEAVESCKQKIKKKANNRESINAEDQEFMDRLSDIARGSGKSANSEADLESNHSLEEDITARDIAEDVLKQSAQTMEASESENALPIEAIVDFDLLNDIDKLCTKIDDYEEPPRHGVVRTEESEVIEIEEIPTEATFEDNDACIIIEDKQKELESFGRMKKPKNKLDFMSVVYTNRDHVLWNEEMIRFYEFSWRQERFNVDQILRLMDRKADWRIINSDRFLRGKKFRNLKCNNCCEWGHRIVDCPMPRKDIICYMCGDIGHKEPRCPNTLCLRCGRKTNAFTRTCKDCISENVAICPICKIRGHSLDNCPDKWRRYHSTTRMNENLNSVVNYNEKKHCCICAGRGHLPEHCRSSNKMNEYHAPTTEIRYHSKAYDDLDVKDPLAPGVIGVHLMSEPDINATFPSLRQVSKEQCYGRFLTSVGLYDPPESKIVRSFVLNPFAKDSGLVDKKELKKTRKRKFNAIDDDIQLNISGVVEIDDEIGSDVVEQVETAEDNTKSNEAVTVDDDSNYSFSEHFPDKDETEGTSESVIRINRKKSVGPLPDFIPLFDESMPKVTRSKPKKVGPLPDFISLNESDDEECKKNTEIEEVEAEEACEGKIYLSKFHSQYLLSPSGTTYLIEASRRHNVKVSMDWTAVGNVLVIEGLPNNQDKFHAELMEKMKAMSEEKSRNTLDQSQKLPRSREVLIRFLQENILNLEKDLGNVHDLYKKMKYNENNYGKSSFKSAEKNRRSLNMILMGQTGLREGPMHLSMLQDKLRELQVEMKVDHVPEDFREELEKSYRYIFSSYKHNNYDQLIRQYTTLKKLNQMPKLGLDYKLLGRKVLDTKFTKEQKERLHSAGEAKPGCNFTDISDAVEFKTPRTEFGIKRRRTNEEREQETDQQMHENQHQFPEEEKTYPHQNQQYPHQNQQYPHQQYQRPMHSRHNQKTMQSRQNAMQQPHYNQQRPNQPAMHARQTPMHMQQQQKRFGMGHQFQHQQQQTPQSRQQRIPQHQRQQTYHQRNQQQTPMQSRHYQQQSNNTTPPPPSGDRNTPSPPPPPQSSFRTPQKNAPFFQKSFHNSPNNQRHQSFQGSNFNAGGQGKRGPYARNKFQEAQKKWDTRIMNINQSQIPTKMNTKPDHASSYWSKESVKFIARCMSLKGLQSNILDRLTKLSDRASKNLLSFNDFKSIKKIYYNLMKADKGGA